MEKNGPAIENGKVPTENDFYKMTYCDGVLDWVIRSIERVAKRDLTLIEKRVFNK